MKRLALLLAVTAVALAPAAHAQHLTMQMSNGWAFSFSGNVNAFWVFTKEDSNATLGSKAANSSIRTGLLPAFATFEAKGKEAGLDLGVHFGFAPQINNAGIHDNFGNGTQAGAQIDMRQVYLTVGGKWGSFLVGRELALFGRQNIVNDQTLFGVGAVGIGGGQGGGTTLGRIGYGYIYPNFEPQVTYTTKSGQPAQLSIGIFQPSVLSGTNYAFTALPRVEGELTYTHKSGRNQLLFWAGGLLQTESNAASSGHSLSSLGVTVGARLGMSDLSVLVSAYTGKALGTLLMFSAIGGGPVATNDSTGRTSDGGYVQVAYNLSKKTMVAASYGLSRLKNASAGEAGGNNGGNGALRMQLTSVTAGIYHQWTPSVKLVAEVTEEHQQGLGGVAPKASQTDVSAGIMLFY